ncbi:MAG: 30S ribosomal protein S5 [Patescibacteria group bacterium]|jgi:small subunit ribosomal protein S5
MMKEVGNRKGGRKGRDREVREKREFEQRVIEIARVTRVVKGGKRMRFRACVVIGDEKGRVSMAIAKGPDVQIAVNKATNQAKKKMFLVPMVDGTIPHSLRIRRHAADILLKPAPKGTGVMAGGALRPVFEVIGLTNVVAKMLGSKSKINNVKALLEGLRMLKPPKKKRTVKPGAQQTEHTEKK